MKSYSGKVQMTVNGNETACLEIWRIGNTFRVFEHDANVFAGCYTKTVEFIENWIYRKKDIADFLKANGSEVEFTNPFK